MKGTNIYDTPLAELLEVKMEGNFLASVEKMTTIQGEWADDDDE